MNRSVFLASMASGITAISGFAQSNQPSDAHPDRFGLSYRAGFNITAKFSGLGGFAAQTDPGPATGGGINRTYDDGFNRVDSAGNVGGLTWNWGYSGAPGQLPGDDTIVMHSSTSAAKALSDNRDDDPQHGFELSYNRRVGVLGKSPWGLELAFNWIDVTIRDDQKLSAPVSRISDAFSLGGITPPLARYAGSFTGPGPMIGDTPTRATEIIPGGASIAGQRNIDANVYGFRLGPYLDVPLADRFGLSFSAGFAAGIIDSEFGFRESITIADVGTVSQRGSDSETDFLWGYYLSGTVNYAVAERTSLFAGVQYQDIGRFSQKAAGKKAELNLGGSFFLTLGVSYAF